MVINDPAYMAMARAADGSELAFDALECLIKTQRRRPITGVLVSDFENPGTWIPAEQAVIARAGFPSPMGGGYAAFASPARAEAAVAARGGVLGSLADFVAGRVKEAP